jgi:ribonuclease R
VTERNSADAERDSKDVKLFAFLKAQLADGDPIKYPALVTDVRNFGFFVDVTGLAMSGLVPLSLMDDDFYVFDEMRRNLVGRRTRRIIRLGDRLTVQVAKVDTFKKQVDFELAVEERKPFAPRPQQSRQQPPRQHEAKRQRDRHANERPQTSRPATFQTSGSKFSTMQRPLIKSSGSQRFSRRRR